MLLTAVFLSRWEVLRLVAEIKLLYLKGDLKNGWLRFYYFYIQYYAYKFQLCYSVLSTQLAN